MSTLKAASWQEINAFREQLSADVARSRTLQDAGQIFASALVERFTSIVLSRVFIVLPFDRLPPNDAQVARQFAQNVEASLLLGPKTPVLSLLGSRGALPEWNDRARSAGHLAIPLLSKRHVESAPMIAQLLADLDVDLAALDDKLPIASRQMLGSASRCFYVSNAKETRDAAGRFIIPNQDFVASHRVETVFGMAGTYIDGTLVASISFTSESLDKLTVDRFPSIITNFKMATAELVARGAIYG